IYAALGICAALVERDRSGTGQRVEVAMLDAVVSLFSDVAANVLTDGQRYGKFGSGHPDLVPYQAFPARDGYFIVACLTNAFWKRLCAAIGREDLLADPRFATNDLRVRHRAAIVRILSDVFRTRECADWIALLEAHDIPVCRVNTLQEILAHPQIEANAAIVRRGGAPPPAAPARELRRVRRGGGRSFRADRGRCAPPRRGPRLAPRGRDLLRRPAPL